MRTTRDPGALRTTDLLVLVILGEGPMHGYALAQALDDRTGGQVRVRPGDLYRVLYRLDRAGWLEEVPEAARPSGDERRTYYRITPLGRRVAREQASMLWRAVAPLVRQPVKGAK
ncbi:MAG TPA: helix-turn-helix transcriptional regulator [Vicinamibacterales bacterium]|nr:helix-turn-helix transcriptional regulator [Vicinamibacterales bacterium]